MEWYSPFAILSPHSNVSSHQTTSNFKKVKFGIFHKFYWTYNKTREASTYQNYQNKLKRFEHSLKLLLFLCCVKPLGINTIGKIIKVIHGNLKGSLPPPKRVNFRNSSKGVGVGGVISNSKVYIAQFGPLNRAFSA